MRCPHCDHQISETDYRSIRNQRSAAAKRPKRAIAHQTRRAIQAALGRGERQSAIARRYGVSPALVCRIKSGER